MPQTSSEFLNWYFLCWKIKILYNLSKLRLYVSKSWTVWILKDEILTTECEETDWKRGSQTVINIIWYNSALDLSYSLTMSGDKRRRVKFTIHHSPFRTFVFDKSCLIAMYQFWHFQFPILNPLQIHVKLDEDLGSYSLPSTISEHCHSNNRNYPMHLVSIHDNSNLPDPDPDREPSISSNNLHLPFTHT